MQQDLKIHIKMLGHFSIFVNDKEINAASLRSPQLLNLLQYLIAFRHKTISPQALMDILWQAEIANPAGALKNLIYRARMAFADIGVEQAKNIIVRKTGGYGWNNAVECTVDCEEFEQLCKTASNTSLPNKERISLYKSALNLYEGGFLSESNPEASAWAVPLNRYFQTMYFTSAYALLNLLEANRQYEQMQLIATKATEIDQMDEASHRYLLKAYMLQGKNDLVVNYYNYINTFFYTELGTALSPETTEIYQQVFELLNHVELNLDAIKAEIKEIGGVEGALCCNYASFKQLYRLQARSSSRGEVNAFAVLLSICEPSGAPPQKQMLSIGMNCLHDIIIGGLRVGDVFARFSATQYIIMLCNVDKTATELVVSRLAENFLKSNAGASLKLITDFRPIDAI